MTKQKERNELEVLRAENRKLKSMNKHLKKEIGRQNKRQHLHDDLEEKMAEEMLKEEAQEKQLLKKEKCPQCSSDEITCTDLGARKLFTCECGYRKSVKK